MVPELSPAFASPQVVEDIPLIADEFNTPHLN